MKKINLVVAFVALMLNLPDLSAQDKQFNFNLSAFNAIVVGGDFDVTVEHGDSYKAMVTVGEQYQEFVICEVHGQILTISIDDRKITNDIKNLFKSKGAATPVFKVTVSTPENISSITLKDKASLTSTKDFSVESFKAAVGDNANLKEVNVNSKFAAISTEKRGTLSLNITTGSLNVNASGTSTMNITQSSNSIDANVSGFCNLSLQGDSGKLTFVGKGNSKAEIKGSIPFADYNIGGSCNVNALNLICDEAVVRMNGICTLSESASKALKVDISGGSTLVFDNTPVWEIEDVKASTLRRYSDTDRKK